MKEDLFAGIVVSGSGLVLGKERKSVVARRVRMCVHK